MLDEIADSGACGGVAWTGDGDQGDLNASIGTGGIDTRSVARMPVGRGWQDSTTTEIRR